MNYFKREAEDFKVLIGQTFTSVIETNGQAIDFHTEKGLKYSLYHEQDCCEDVRLEDICGDLNDLVGTPILLAEESSSTTDVKDDADQDEDDGATACWTFYRLSTIKGSVVIRFYGCTNSCYAIDASLYELESMVEDEENY